MKRLSTLLIGLLVCLAAGGCQSAGSRKQVVDVVIENNGQFPAELAGRWKGDGKNGWEIVFERDGIISSAIISLGQVEIVPGEEKIIPMKEGGKGIYRPGQWTVQYSASNRELIVNLVMDYVHLEMGPSLLEGKSSDMFVGPISEDGKTWRTELFSFPDYITYTPEPKRLTLDGDDNPVGIVTFTKVEE